MVLRPSPWRTALFAIAAGAIAVPVLVALTPIAGATNASNDAVTVTNTASNPVPVTGTVNVGNLPASQAVTGTVNVGNLPAVQTVSGTVQILPDVPVTEFSRYVPAYGLVSASAPFGTKWAITSMAVANAGSQPELGELVIGRCLNGPGFDPGDGPNVMVAPGSTVDLTFPQPWIMTSPASGDCLVLGAQSDIAASIVGYVIPPS